MQGHFKNPNFEMYHIIGKKPKKQDMTEKTSPIQNLCRAKMFDIFNTLGEAKYNTITALT